MINYVFDYYEIAAWDLIMSALQQVLFPSRCGWLADALKIIDNHAKHIQLAKEPFGQERCLTCGSYVVQLHSPIREGGGFKSRGDFMYHGEHKTDFEHPGCGGIFYKKAHKMRFSMVFYLKFYKTDGVFIESYCKKSIECQTQCLW